MVQKCALHLLYQHDQVQFEQELRHCNDLILEQREDFDQCRVYNSCFPLREILEWFSHQSDEPPVTIPLPPNVFNDNTWMGLVLCASIAVEANPTAILDIQNLETTYNLICHLETNVECVEPLHVHHITEEDLKLLQQGAIDFPGLVQKSGFHLLYKHDEVEFKETIRQCMALFSNEQANETNTQLGKSDLLDFDQCRVYKSCFPLREIPEWFSHQSNEAPVTIPLPPNAYNDSNWMGLALCAYVAIEANLDAFLDIQNSETSYNLISHLETSIECAEPLHVHHITKEDLKLLQQGGFIWLSYIPRGSYRDSLNQSSWIEASVVVDFPGLVQKCGFHLLYKHDEVEFKETIRQWVTLFSNEDKIDEILLGKTENFDELMAVAAEARYVEDAKEKI
uniref:C-JID domain-containing protein n=1 Tax=Quercus lobata TaxID=97700 RepID=A0A7N2LDJ0_QUELO